MSVATSATKPASVARVLVVRGGRAGVVRAADHPSLRGRDPTELLNVSEIDEQRLAVLNAILARPERLEFGTDAPDEGKEAAWLTEHLARDGNRRTGAFGVVVTVGKGLSMLAEADADVDAAVQEALRAGASAYVEYVANHAKTRIGPLTQQEHVAIDPASLRSVGWLHGHSAAGDPHRHAHILIASTAFVPGDERGRAVHAQHFLKEVAHQAEAAARVAMIRTLRARGLEIDPLSMDLAGIDEQVLKYLERFSAMGGLVHEIMNQGISHDEAWRAGRRFLNGDNRQPLTDKLRPLAEEVREWADRQLIVHTPDGEDFQLRFSSIEAVEHALDALSRTPEGRETVIAYQQERSGGAFLEAVNELERIIEQGRRQELTPDELIADYLRRLGQAAEAGQVLTRQSLESHAQAIAAAHDELEFEHVNEVLQANFVELRGRRGLVAAAELKANIEVAERAMDHLVKAETVQDALTQSVGLTVTQGVAGAGKTTAVMQAARENWAYERGHIWVLSRNAKTAHDLGDAVQAALAEVRADPNRVHAMPLADPSWREHIKQGDRIVVDEFALTERSDLDDLIELSTVCPVSLVGDPHQQRAIENPMAAQMIALVADAAGQPNLTDTMRCKAWRELHDDLRAAAHDEAARERAVEALDIRTVGSAAEAAAIAREAGAVLFAVSNELVAEASAKPINGPAVTVRHGVEVGVGEQVVFRAIVRDERRHILGRTGDVATIVAIADAHAILKHEDGRLAVVSLKDAREHLGPAAAQTIDSAQGRTVERAAVLLTGLTGSEDTHALYTGATRGREAPLILVMRSTEQDERSRAVGVDQNFDPRQVVSDVLSRSERVTVLGLPDEDRQALLDELRERGHVVVADRLERLEADMARLSIRKQAQQQEKEKEQAQEQEAQQAQQEPWQQAQERARAYLRKQAQEQEAQQAQERGFGWGLEI